MCRGSKIVRICWPCTSVRVRIFSIAFLRNFNYGRIILTLKRKRQWLEYHHPTSPSAKKFLVAKSSGKVSVTIHLLLFLSGRHIDVMETGTTINSKHFVDRLGKLLALFHRIRKDLDPIFQHDNVHPQRLRETQQGLQRLQLKEVHPHPSYSPDFAPCNFHLCPKMNIDLKIQHFYSDNEAKAAIRCWCLQKPSAFFPDGFYRLLSHWRTDVERDGNTLRSEVKNKLDYHVQEKLSNMFTNKK